jgi:large subunit ribosomal protein L6
VLYKTIILKKSNVVFLQENAGYMLKGPLGSSLFIPYNIDVIVNSTNSSIVLESSNASIFLLYKKLFLQKVRGVLYGYKKKLKLKGVGYVAELLKNQLILKLGFSSPVGIIVPPSIKIKIKKRKLLKIIGCDLNEITQFASNIRQNRVPEVYKGKGVLYFREKVNFKTGKKN